jgi:predicted metal-dependent hydrolase
VEQQRLLFDEPDTPRLPQAGEAPPPYHTRRQAVPVPAGESSTSESSTFSVESPGPAVEYVRHPRARRYLIRVRLDGSVRVTIPRRGSRREAVEFYDRQREWIRSQQQRVAAARHRLPAELPEERKRELRARARTELPARLLELAGEVGVSVRRISVRDQRQRWGSCSPSGLICLNWRLVTMPDWVRDYVLYHELMHLKRMDHSPAFWKLVAQACPDYQKARRWLRRHALAPHAPDAHAEAHLAKQSTADGM